jgi:exopolysaccharide biosynthesis polyprenyl glycosylphosphotransferase
MLHAVLLLGDLLLIAGVGMAIGETRPLVSIAVWLVALAAAGTYRAGPLNRSVRIADALLRASVLAMGMLAIAQVVLGEADPWALSWGVLAPGAALVVYRLLFFRVQALFTGASPVGVVVVGTGRRASMLAGRLEAEQGRPWVVLGFVGPPGEASPVLGELNGLEALVREVGASVVVFADQVAGPRGLELAAWGAAHDVDILAAPFGSGLVSPRVEGVELGRVGLSRVGGVTYPASALVVKRTFDLAVIVLMAPLVGAVLGLAATLIRREDDGPVLYVSERAGQWGEAFGFYKLRSMRVGAANERDGIANDSEGPLFKATADPRVTEIGATLRRWSIDELPQLINVLKGDMNLVGPRPLPIEDLEGIERDPEHWYWFQQRCRVKPGITGLWQVAGRSDLPFAAMVDLDVYYIQNWSLLLDLQILVRTVPAVIRGRGAR